MKPAYDTAEDAANTVKEEPIVQRAAEQDDNDMVPVDLQIEEPQQDPLDDLIRETILQGPSKAEQPDESSFMQAVSTPDQLLLDLDEDTGPAEAEANHKQPIIEAEAPLASVKPPSDDNLPSRPHLPANKSSERPQQIMTKRNSIQAPSSRQLGFSNLCNPSQSASRPLLLMQR